MKKLIIPAFLAVVALANAEELKLSNYILNTSFSGDARVKYEMDSYDKTTSDADYFTTRLRLNTTTKINDNFSFGSRLRFQKEPIGSDTDGTVSLQRLYMDYKTGNHSIRVGRMGSPLYLLNDMLIDTNVEGLAYSTKFNNTQLKAGFLLRNAKTTTETSDENSIIYAQGIQTIKIGENKLVVEASAYSEDNKETSPKNQAEKAFTLGAEYTQSLTGPIQMAQIKGQYIMTDADDDNSGYSAGLVIGSKEIKEKGSWQGIAEYKSLEKNGFIYVNSDTKLDQKIAKIGAIAYVAPNTNLEVTYEMYDYVPSSKEDKNVLSTTLNYTF